MNPEFAVLENLQRYAGTLRILMFFSDLIGCILHHRQLKMNLDDTYSKKPAFVLQSCKNEPSFVWIVFGRVGDFDGSVRQNAVVPCDESSGAGASVTEYCLRHNLYPIVGILFIVLTPSFIRHVFWVLEPNCHTWIQWFCHLINVFSPAKRPLSSPTVNVRHLSLAAHRLKENQPQFDLWELSN